MKHQKTYDVWNAMMQRCHNPGSVSYKYYGARGIKVCDAWQTYSGFFVSMGEKPEGLSLERKDNNQGYFPENCIWTTMSQQANNRRQFRLNESGLVGVYWTHRESAWKVRLKSKHIGTYYNLLDAVAARKSAENKYVTESITQKTIN